MAIINKNVMLGNKYVITSLNTIKDTDEIRLMGEFNFEKLISLKFSLFTNNNILTN